MHKYILTLFALLIAMGLFAQIQKGAFFLEGSLSYNSSKSTNDFSINSSFVNDEIKTGFLDIAPGVGFLVSDHTALGFSLGYRNNKTESTNTLNTVDPGDPVSNFSTFERTRTFSLGFFLQGFIRLKDDLLFTPRAQFSYGFGDREYDDSGDVSNDLRDVSIALSPSFKYFLTNRWAISAGIGTIGYNRLVEELNEDAGVPGNPENVQENFNVSFGINTFRLGAQYFFNNN